MQLKALGRRERKELSVDRKGEKWLQKSKARPVLNLPVSKNTEREWLIPAKAVELMGQSVGSGVNLAWLESQLSHVLGAQPLWPLGQIPSPFFTSVSSSGT